MKVTSSAGFIGGLLSSGFVVQCPVGYCSVSSGLLSSVQWVIVQCFCSVSSGLLFSVQWVICQCFCSVSTGFLFSVQRIVVQCPAG